MKLNKGKGKGKVHPSPSSSSASSSSTAPFSSNDPISALNLLLPAAILTLISALSLQDREVLAYMLIYSLKSSPVNFNNPSAAPIFDDNNHHHRSKRKSKKSAFIHKSPSFDCDCFDCYTAYWFRWDSSPCRELIHQVIEAFEEHLATSEQPKKSTKGRKREKEKNPAPQSKVSEVIIEDSPAEKEESPSPALESSDSREEYVAQESTAPAPEPEPEPTEEEEMSKQQQQRGQEHKGLARKMLPDVIGLFNSRLWNLWGPNV